LNNICSAQTKVLVKEPTTPRFSLHTKDKSTTEEKEACLDQNARQISTKQQQATMSEDIMESFAPTWEDIKVSMIHANSLVIFIHGRISFAVFIRE
jgi:hypothetical protein